MKNRPAALCLSVLLGCAGIQATVAQTDPEPEQSFAEPEGPGAARFEPAPDADEEIIEEIIVTGVEDKWGLPDLGSQWRVQQEEEEDEGRFDAEFLPLYDPDNPPERNQDMLINKEEERVGFVELFRFRFGGKKK